MRYASLMQNFACISDVPQVHRVEQSGLRCIVQKSVRRCTWCSSLLSTEKMQKSVLNVERGYTHCRYVSFAAERSTTLCVPRRGQRSCREPWNGDAQQPLRFIALFTEAFGNLTSETYWKDSTPITLRLLIRFNEKQSKNFYRFVFCLLVLAKRGSRGRFASLIQLVIDTGK